MFEVISIIALFIIGFPLLIFEVIGVICMCFNLHIRTLMINEKLPKEMWRDFT